MLLNPNPEFQKSSFMGQDIGVQDGPTIRPIIKQTKHGKELKISLTAVDQKQYVKSTKKVYFYFS